MPNGFIMKNSGWHVEASPTSARFSIYIFFVNV
nr:MAG TPA: hypothetical protein [Caudoviricetes sp.]